MITTVGRFSLLRQLAWATTLAAGFATAWFLIVITLTTWIHNAWSAEKPRTYESVVVRSDGSLMIQSYDPDNASHMIYRDLQGHVQNPPERDDQIWPVNMFGKPQKVRQFTPPPDWSSRLTIYFNEQQPDLIWYFVHDGKPVGAGYFVAYNQRTNQREGFLGMSGFRVDPLSRADWIPVQGNPQSSMPSNIYSGRTGSYYRAQAWDVPPHLVYLPSGTLLRRADLAARSVTTVFETQEPIVAVGVPWLSTWTGGHFTRERPNLVRTTHEIQVIDQQNHVIRKFAIPAEIEPHSQVAWYELGNSQAIAIVLNRIVFRIGADGTIQDRYTVDLQTGSSVQNDDFEAWNSALGAPSPAILLGVGLLIEIEAGSRDSDQAAAAIESVWRFWPWFIGVLAFSSILAVTAWRRTRGFGLSRGEQVSWALFVWLFGLPAYAGFRLSRRWPVRLPCPECHSAVPRDRTACAECGTQFPDPGLKGIEIFA